jgi:hypothetical protein
MLSLVPCLCRYHLPKSPPAEKPRGAEIILRQRRQRIVFLAGLVGAIVLGWFISLWGAA